VTDHGWRWRSIEALSCPAGPGTPSSYAQAARVVPCYWRIVVAFRAVLFEALVSPAYDTEAVFVTVGYAALPTPTVSETAALPPAAIEVEVVQVTVCPETEQVQPFPEAEVKVSPAGSGSTIVTAPAVLAGPRFDTVRM
jgi:hypothetical protein